MNDRELETTVSPALQLVDPAFAGDEQRLPSQWGDYREAELLERLRLQGELDEDSRSDLEQGLVSEQNPVRLWFLLACLEHLPARSVATELIFNALRRLVQSSSPLIRLAAYRWLAGIYKYDLRFENRARLTMRDCLPTESGLMRQRLEHLLSIC